MSTILAVSSSPRRGGNSELLLQSFSQGVQKEGGSSTQSASAILNSAPAPPVMNVRLLESVFYRMICRASIRWLLLPRVWL